MAVNRIKHHENDSSSNRSNHYSSHRDQVHLRGGNVQPSNILRHEQRTNSNLSRIRGHMPDSRSNRNINPHNDRIMQLEKQIDGLTVTVKGRAGTELVFAGHGEYPDESKAYWIDEPEIVDVHNNYYDVTLTPEEEKGILDNLDINDFVC